ncbi:MAG: hypothetical protein OEV37_02650 [Candidatus Berkelbacteria bacterium]|nr:hypothetical protein [Candidatus Berkelbacteria bacterium]
MDYLKIVKTSWQIVKKYRFIWWLGLLAMFVEGGSAGVISWNPANSLTYIINGNNQSGYEQQIQDYFDEPTPADEEALPEEGDMTPVEQAAAVAWNEGRVLGDEVSAVDDEGEPEEDSNDSDLAYGLVAVGLTVGLLLLALGLVLYYVGSSARAGIILSVDELEEGGKGLGFKEAFHRGRGFAWRLVGLKFLIILINIVILALLSLPAILVLALNQSVVSIVIAVLYGVTAIVIWVIAAIYLNLAETLAARALVLKNGKILDVFEQARGLIKSRFVQVILSYLVSYLVMLIVGMIIFLAILLFIAIFGLMGFLVFLLSQFCAVIYAVMAITVLALASLVVSAGLTGFIATYWTLVYRELKAVKKPA